MLFLKCARDYASFKSFGSLFYKSVLLNGAVVNPWVLFYTCLVQVVAYFLSSMGYFLLKIILCERRSYIVKAFIYFNYQNLEILRMDFVFCA